MPTSPSETVVRVLGSAAPELILRPQFAADDHEQAQIVARHAGADGQVLHRRELRVAEYLRLHES